MHTDNSWWQYGVVLLAIIFAMVSVVSPEAAAVSSSSNYQVVETDFSASSGGESCSPAYCARVSIGDSSVGSSQGDTLKTDFSAAAPEDPTLEVIVEAGQSNLGRLSTEQTATKTLTVRIRNHLTGGYTLQIIGQPPTYDGRALERLATPTSSRAGVEQFGLNVVKNTSPSTGADPLQVPDGQNIFGRAADGYNTPNLFKYQSGDVIGYSDVESGRTDYTISMVVNVSSTTLAGNYTSDFAAVVMPAY
ncbi:MAG: hypothetical protein WBP12_00885 [Candidatus Saccharimonas sp.]